MVFGHILQQAAVVLSSEGRAAEADKFLHGKNAHILGDIKKIDCVLRENFPPPRYHGQSFPSFFFGL